MITVALVDDQQLVRSGFRMILEVETDIEVVGEAADGVEGVRLAKRERPDVVLMDIQMPQMDGLEATRIIAGMEDPPRVIILTTFEQDDYVFTALRNGASGFLLKNAPPEQLVDAVRVVAGGESLLAPSVTRRIIEEFARHPAAGRVVPSLPDPLTDRELEVLGLVARGRSNSEIAEDLFVGEATVKTHVSNVFLKLGVRDRVQAVVWAYENGLARPGP